MTTRIASPMLHVTALPRVTFPYCVLLLSFVATPARGSAQPGGFVMTLGTDTVQVEQVTRTDRTITGLIPVVPA